ncbi:MAG: SHOCT domain-containing protein [Myxococcales bacterium]|nr:SHOCT domain-containing protein [Myxococcales bacterium]
MTACRTLLLSTLALGLASAGCVKTVSLRYVPPEVPAGSAGPGLVSVQTFRDARRNGPYDLGRVRGLFGNAIKLVRTEERVAEEATRVFREALDTRGLLAPDSSGPLFLGGEIRKLDCSQYSEREAHTVLAIRVIDSRGRTLLEGLYESQQDGGGAFTAGVFASRRRLAALAERTLTEAIDAALSDPAFVLAASGIPHVPRAGPVLPSGSRPPGSPPETELEALERLYEQGLVSDEEYARRRANLLGAL